MILIITHKADFTADFLINKLNGNRIPFKRLNCEDVFKNNCCIRINNTFSYSLGDLAHFDSVWFRRTKLPNIELDSINEEEFVLTEYDALLRNLLAIVDSKWVSDPYSVYKAENKIFQLKKAVDVGFKIPDTLITSSKTDLLAFYTEKKGKIIIKPLGYTKSNHSDAPFFIFTNRVKREHIEHLSEFDLTPSIFQEEVEKEFEIRVTVVGNMVFAAKVDSQSNEETKIDWRRQKLQFEKFDLPFKITDLCRQIVSNLNLKFGAIDLIKDRAGNYIFLEINPNGQWAWIENQTGLNISGALIQELTT